MTIFVCTPYMDEAERCNQIGLIYQGRMIASGTPNEIKNLVPGQLLEFTPDPERFDETSDLVQHLSGVSEVQTYGVMLHVFVDDAQKRQGEIGTSLTSRGLSCGGMRQIEPRMEEAFISLINRQQAITSKVGKNL